MREFAGDHAPEYALEHHLEFEADYRKNRLDKDAALLRLSSPPTPVYLAARYTRLSELCQYAHDLRREGFVVTSRWLGGSHEMADDGSSAEGTEAERERFALEDWRDLMAADWVISFTEPARTGPARGGRHVEFGAALAAGKRCIVVGHRENVFHCLPQVEFFATWADCLAAISIEAGS